MTKYIFVTGGVVSGLGKGITAASLGPVSYTHLDVYKRQLFDKGEWDWNKMLELAETLTIDSNRDGTPEQYGLGFDEPEHILYTTGKHFITFMPDGTARNNIQSPEVARAVAYNQKMIQSGTLVPANGRQAFGEGSVCLLYTSRCV